MPGQGNGGNRGGNGGGHGHGGLHGQPGELGQRGEGGQGGEHGRSASSPGHLKRDAGAQSARDFAPGHRGDPAGETPRDAGEAGVERPEPDSLERET